MVKRIQTYETDEIVVTYDPDICTHAGECVRGLPAVFDSSRPDWIRPQEAPAAQLADVIRRCPSGALQYRMKREAAAVGEPAPSRAAIGVTLLRNGPLLLDGEVRVTAEDGTALVRTGKVALCRCGGTGNQPFCDGSHERVGFRSAR
jgi:uncharacterized Fe-S cluster protein YjdI